MKRSLLSLLIIGSLAFTACTEDNYKPGQKAPEIETEDLLPQKNGKVAVGYITYYGTATPAANEVTQLNYSFAELYMDGDKYIKFGLQGNKSRFDQVMAVKKKNPNLKIVLSFTNSVDNYDNVKGGGFSALAKDPEARKKFANDCYAFCVNNHMDGIDIDWEFPGMTWGSNAYDAQVDVANHVLLMKDLREALGSRFSLSYAGYIEDMKPVGSDGWKYIDIKGCDPYVDYVYIMTYDLLAAPYHHSALYTGSYNCDNAVKVYLNAGIKPEKLVMGVPFYARRDFNSGGVIDYKDVVKLGSGYKIDNWDDAACVPYITKDGKYYAGYDNARSIDLKGKYVAEKGMAGLMFWDYDGDDNQGTLRRALWNAVMKY